jgi:hypothetical protein
VEILHCYTAAHGESDAQARSRAIARSGELLGAIRATDERWRTIPHRIDVSTEPAAEALCRRSAAASLLVLGTRGPAALAGLSQPGGGRRCSMPGAPGRPWWFIDRALGQARTVTEELSGVHA